MLIIEDVKNANLDKLLVNILCGDIVVLKNAVSTSLIVEAKKEACEWYIGSPQSMELPKEEEICTHLRSYLPARSEARYILHDFYFNFTAKSSDKLSKFQSTYAVFLELLDLYNNLLKKNYSLDNSYNGFSFVPQLIRYPRGGGFFSEHYHGLLPQTVGIILSGSEYGKDYMVGGGRFRSADGSWINTESILQPGDITLFRYDLGHDITPIDPDFALDWSRNDGRWTFVLPFKPVQKN